MDALAVIEQVISRIDSIRFSETGSGLSRSSMGWNPAGRIEAYGISCQPPQDFWYTKKGWIEAARRIREHRHTTGTAPSSSEVMVTLGLGGFVKAYERYGYGYDFIMNTVSQLTVKIDALMDSRRAQQQP